MRRRFSESSVMRTEAKRRYHLHRILKKGTDGVTIKFDPRAREISCTQEALDKLKQGVHNAVIELHDKFQYNLQLRAL